MDDDKRSVTSSQSAPPVPLQTYIWEDLRRQKSRGLYPWTHLYKGPFTGSLHIELDHEYEPITPMSTTRPTPPPILKVTTTSPANTTETTSNDKISTAAASPKEPQLLKLPTEEELQDQQEEEYEVEEFEEEEYDEEEVEEEEEMSDEPGEFEDEEDEEMTAQELQARMEERFFNQTPAPVKSALSTKSKAEPSTSGQRAESSSKQGEPPAETQSFQQKLKTQADKFKTTLQTLSKRKEAPKSSNETNENDEEQPTKSKFQFPKRPKFDRSKFKLPDTGKFKKFNMPERAKFKMPDRSKLSLPDRSKFKFPDRPKISLSNLRLPRRSNSFKEGDPNTATSTMGSKKNLFDFRTYPRIFNKRKREETGREEPSRSETPNLKPESIPTSSSAPSTPRWKRANLTQKWSTMITELKSKQANKKRKPNDDTSPSQSSSGFKPKSYPATESLDDSDRQRTRSASSGLDTDKEQQSSGASSLRDRKGVLEEINSDEFFLREKGLSRDNVDVSQFLTREIRDAFKADKEESDFEDEEVVPEEVPQKKTSPAQRSKSFSRFINRFHKKDKKEEDEKKDQYKTYPPRKSERKRKESELFLIIPLKDENDPDFEPSIPVSDHTDEDYETQRQTFKAVVKPQSNTLTVPSLTAEQTSPKPDELKKKHETPSPSPSPVPQTPTQENKENVVPIKEIVVAQVEEVPSAPRRKKSLSMSLKSEGILKDVESNKDNKSLGNGSLDNKSLGNRSLTNRSLERERSIKSFRSEIEPEPEIRQYPTPVAPRRRSRSLGTSLTSEDRTSRGAESMPSEEHDETVSYAMVDKTLAMPPVTPPRSRPPRPPPPCRRRRTFNMIRDQGLKYFFTVPRRKSYVEDLPIVEKSYSTLGPTRPPRRHSRSRGLKEPLYADGSIHSDISYIDKDSETKSLDHRILQDFADDFKLDISGSVEDKDLQSDDVIEKMKGRPLPPPPRPPRKSKQDGGDESDTEDIEQDAKSLKATEPIKNAVKDLQTEDVSIAIQTDPLSDEYIVTSNDEPGEEENDFEKKQPREIPLKGERKSLSQDKKNEPKPKAEEINNFETPTLPLRRDRRSQSKDKLKDTKPLNTDNNNLRANFLDTSHPPVPVEEPRIQPISTFRVTTGTLPSVTTTNQSENSSTLPRYSNFSQAESTAQATQRKEEPTPKPPLRQKDPEPNQTPPQKETEKLVERQIFVVSNPESEVTLLKAQKLQIQELDVSKINVSELQASKITVHELDSDVVNVSRINSSSGNLIIDNVELPSDILQSITQSITGAISFSSHTIPSQRSQMPLSETHDQSAQVAPHLQSAQSQTQTTPSTNEATQTKLDNVDSTDPVRPNRRRSSPDYAVPVPKFYRTRQYSFDSENEVMIVPIPVPRSRRRNHDENTSSNTHRSHTTHVPDPEDSVLDLGRRLVNVISADVLSLIQAFMQQIPRGEKQSPRDTVQMFMCIFITIFALFFLMGFGSGSKTIHTHHWDYQFPPTAP